MEYVCVIPKNICVGTYIYRFSHMAQSLTNTFTKFKIGLNSYNPCTTYRVRIILNNLHID